MDQGRSQGVQDSYTETPSRKSAKCRPEFLAIETEIWNPMSLKRYCEATCRSIQCRDESSKLIREMCDGVNRDKKAARADIVRPVIYCHTKM